MAVSSVDTDRLKDLSKDIMSLANQYDIQITKALNDVSKKKLLDKLKNGLEIKLNVILN